MHSIETLNIVGHRNEILPSTFFRQKDESPHIAVIFPGFGYTAQMPLMYYPGRLLLESGADVLLVGYNYFKRPDFRSAPDEERDVWLRTDTIAAYEAALAERDYERVTLVGKSIGTRGMGHLLSTTDPLPSLQCVWLTPILRNEQLCAQIKQNPCSSLFVVGSADSHYDPVKLAEVQQATGGKAIVIENADHSLEIPGDIVESIRALEGIIAEIQKFLS
ncbi:MAG: alpha/beta family hydrolase [Desulfomonilaceae bacterium]